MSADKRKHGGKRPNAGRPSGSTNSLPYGAVEAIRSLRLRVPKDAHEDVANLAGEALETIVNVMRGIVPASEAGNTLKAATLIRNEVCGPVTQKLEHTGPEGGALQIVVQKIGADE